MRLAYAIAGFMSIAVGGRWLQLFVFTDYRAHLRPFIVPLGLVAVVLGVCLLLLSMRGSLRLRGHDK